jgi:hypothetical protein
MFHFRANQRALYYSKEGVIYFLKTGNNNGWRYVNVTTWGVSLLSCPIRPIQSIQGKEEKKSRLSKQKIREEIERWCIKSIMYVHETRFLSRPRTFQRAWILFFFVHKSQLPCSGQFFSSLFTTHIINPGFTHDLINISCVELDT